MAPVTQSLLIANIAIYLLQMAGLPLFHLFALWPPNAGFQPTQLVTYAFLHGSLTHIAFNMFGLYTFGSAVERLFGARFYLAYYFGSVVAAGLLHLVVTAWMGGPPVPTVGASGGIYGLMLAFAAFFPRQVIMLLIPPIPLKARTFVILFGALELFFGVTGTASGVAHFAHLGGMLGGWLMIVWRRNRRPPRP